jgi:hypothetical protein
MISSVRLLSVLTDPGTFSLDRGVVLLILRLMCGGTIIGWRYIRFAMFGFSGEGGSSQWICDGWR